MESESEITKEIIGKIKKPVPTFEKARDDEELIEIDLNQQLYVFNDNGLVIPRQDTLYLHLIRALRDERDEKHQIIKKELEKKEKREGIIQTLLELKVRGEKLVLKKIDDSTRIFLLKRIEKIWDAEITMQIKAILQGKTNTFQMAYEAQDVTIDYELLKEKVEAIEDIEMLKILFIDLLGITSIAERENLLFVSQFFKKIIKKRDKMKDKKQSR